MSGGTTPYGWSATGLPLGLSVAAGRISGTPLESGSFSPVVTVTDAAGRTTNRTYSLTIGFGKWSPANGSKLPNTTTTVALTWYPHAGASGYRWCAAASTKACSSWTTTSATSANVPTLPGQAWNWQAQVLIGGTWTGANGGSGWKFSINR